MINDTIAAIATALSDSGVGIIRISGDESLAIAASVFRAKNKKWSIDFCESHKAVYGEITDGDKSIDECLLLPMKAPHSYTREDVVEIQCHGGVMVMKKILELVMKKGARIAEPGEFTKRAFLNGRMDLSQAEAVMDVIHAKNEYALSSSVSQLRGNIRDTITTLRSDILYQIAFIESALDDPEHISLDGYPEQLYDKVLQFSEKVRKLIASSENGKMQKEGIRTVIIGKPNAGKSSLLNYLVGQERAIVTEIEGTTRDTLEEYISIHGIPLHVIDTAGIRSTEDIVEKIGVDKAIESLKDADLILYVVDGTRKLDENDAKIRSLIHDKNVIVLLNKADLDTVVMPEELSADKVISVSTKDGTGMDDFYEELKDIFFKGQVSFNDEVMITNMRHKEALEQALISLEKVLDSINNGMPEDFFSIDLMDAYEVLGRITGESVDEDLVNKIFSEFCTGK